MPETPHKTSQRIDQIIDHLNTRWDLQIPRIHGLAAVKAGDGSDLGKKCSSRIRALCWKGNVNMKSVIEEFEDKVQHKYSHWIWKPSQVSGTLPSLPATKSFLKRDAISKTHGMSSQRRQTFLRALSDLLEDEYKLAAESDQYTRTPSVSRDVSRQTSFADNRSASSGSFATAEQSTSALIKTEDTVNASESKMTRPASLKRREASQATTASSKRAKMAIAKLTSKPMPKELKGQQSLESMIRKLNDHSVESGTSIPSAQTDSAEPSGLVASFNTIASEEPDRVFSVAGSNRSSFSSTDSDANKGRRVTELSGTQYSNDTEFDEEIYNDVNVQISFERQEADTQARDIARPVTIAELLEKLAMRGPFKHLGCPLPPKLSYWYVFELYRIGSVFPLSVKRLWTMLRDQHGKEQLSSEELWKAVKSVHGAIDSDQEGRKVPLPAKSNIPSWMSHNDSYCDPDSGNSISFTARLDFSKNPIDQLFDFTLNPIKYEKSCRFHRHFGADRFLTIDMPYYENDALKECTKSMPKGREDLPNLHGMMFKWLTTNDLQVAGRVWRAFYVEPIKSRSKQKRNEEKPRQRLHLFAIEGHGLDKSGQSSSIRSRPISLLDFVNWHLLLDHNQRSTDMKLFARMQLGLSRTLPTIVLEPDEFIDVPDVPAQDSYGRPVNDGTVMTDGCARISYQLALAVWAHHGKTGDVPSAFQARIGGAKGLWQVDYANAHPQKSKRGFWIEVRDSQLKIKPHPGVHKGADASQRTFEVVKCSSPCVPGHLNTQLINIMHYCGVSRAAIADALNTDLAEYLALLKDAMNDSMELRIWRQLHHHAPSDELVFCGGMPDSKEDEVDYLLESGFAPRSCRYLNDCLRIILKQKLDSYVDKLRIQIEASTTVFCIPDPLGILAPGEVQLNFSTSKIDPRTKLPEMHLESPRVLVARNPAHLASDVQLVKAVYHHELRHLKDVIIFSVKGRYPLADLLSGGDYDGDTVTVIWDPKLTDEFRNHDKPRLATKAECGIKSKTNLVGNVFKVNGSNPNQTELQLKTFLHTCCSLNGFRSRLGEVTVEHERLIYTDLILLGKQGPERLAALAGYLVDSAKQGDSFDDADWESLRTRVRQMCGIGKHKKLENLAYKKGADLKPRRRKDGQCKNIVDHLKFDVAKGLRDNTLARFNEDWTMGTIWKDDDLGRPYSTERERVMNSKLPEHMATEKVLDDLCKKIRAIHVEWIRRAGSNEDDMPGTGSSNSNKTVRNDFAQVVQELSEQIHVIEPLEVDCDIRRDFERNRGVRGSWWSTVRASCVHYQHKKGAFPWKMVGDELCDIKADAQGRTWRMTLAARQIMKADPKKYKRLNEAEDDTVEEFYDAEDS